MTIEELETYFATKELPATYQLSRSHFISNVRKYVETNIMQANIYGSSPRFGFAYDRLI